jgi:hypothetical protein
VLCMYAVEIVALDREKIQICRCFESHGSRLTFAPRLFVSRSLIGMLNLILVN